jgi:23S rRNA pseudouridine1911/1915/1917 synthase
VTHEQMDFTSELADDMQALVDKWRNYTRNNDIT